MWKRFVLTVVLGGSACVGVAQTAPNAYTASQLGEMARARPGELKAAVAAAFPAADLQGGTAWMGQGKDFFFATRAASRPELWIDDAAGPAMQAVSGEAGLWWASAEISQVGKLHAFYYVVDGKKTGGRLDIPAFGPLSYLLPGVPSGTLSEEMVFTSRIYDGMKSHYWVYVPAEYDPKVPAALMVFQDGAGYIKRTGNNPALNVIDNLIAQKKIPVMICVFIDPGEIAETPVTPTYTFVKGFSDKTHRTLKDSMRSTLYDTVSDRYPRFLRDEILASVQAKYNIRKDSYSRAITGLSSGGICSFNAAWQMPDQFSRVLTWIGSFTAIQWKEDAANPDGGQDYAEKVLREPHRNIRVWLQDGANDQENERNGSWPLANLRMANALKLKGYDFHFSFGKGTHNSAHGAAEFPQEMIWLWRGYDPAKTEETYVIDPAEKDKPVFRVAGLNRE